MNRASSRTVLFVAFTAILFGYLSTWLPHDSAGLSFVGLEMGEQAKFLPQVRTGELVPSRSLFYVPPASLGLMLAFTSSHWPRRWQTWVLRGMAIAVSLLSFPAIEAIGQEPAEWLWRVLMIALVVLASLISGHLSGEAAWVAWLLFSLAATAGAVLPTWAFLAVRRAFAEIMARNVGVGTGVWLNFGGHVSALAVAVAEARHLLSSGQYA